MGGAIAPPRPPPWLRYCNRWLRLLTMLLTGPSRIYIAQSPWHCGDFRKILLRNAGEGPKKFLTI